ncbi:MAG: ABC transporter ATP-binding protein [Betaproteobacteria bacterium]|nr:ABC transporter ATP-binding protein [Betaproteobacteria bacterium]
MEANSTPLLQVKNLQVRFRVDRQTTFEAVKRISFDIPRNQTVALVGESGSGKSVSGLAVMGLLPPETALINEDARIIFDDMDLLGMSIRERRRLCGTGISMIFQEPMSSLNPVFTVGFQIAEMLRVHRGLDAKQARKRAIELLDEVGIADPRMRIDAYPHQLSGGQQQRVMIAMAIACDPKLLIADEPTTALDVTIQKQIIDLIRTLQQRHHMSVLFITHDLQLVSEIADQVIVMRHGEIQETGSTEQVFLHPAHPYTTALLACRPTLDARPWHLPVIEDILHPENDREEMSRQRVRGYAENDQILLEVRHLSKHFFSREGFFGRKAFPAVKEVSFALPKGKTLGVVGESGSGKTTMGLTLLRLHEPTGGQAFFDGKDLFALSEAAFFAYKRRIQIVFQNPFASLNPRFTVGQILMEPMRIHGIGSDDRERMAGALQWLKRVGLPETAFYRYPHEFSGGQRQRIAIARCLTLQPEVLVCDESVSALDVSVQAQILNLLQDLQDEFGISYLFISHDLSVVKYMADQVMVMQHGEVVEMADSDEIYLYPKHPYTRTLLEAIPKGRHF